MGDDLRSLGSLPLEYEILEALKSIDVNSSPRSGGFRLLFYISCWRTIKEDMKMVVREFFQGNVLPGFFTASFIVLIPKVSLTNFALSVCVLCSTKF